MKHVKENNLVYGEWEKWCNDQINISPRQARKYIRVFNEFENRKLTSDMSLGIDAMNLLVDFTDEQIEQPHTISSTGQEKSVDEMTVRELREVKKALKEAQDKLNNKDSEIKKRWE